MHPIIAFLSFLFSPADDWSLQSAYVLFLNPQDVPAIVEQYKDFIQKYPSETKDEKPSVKSIDATSMSTWAEILFQQNHPDFALGVWENVLKKIGSESHLSEDIEIRLGEIALKEGQHDKAIQIFSKIAEQNGTRALDAKINLLICDMAKKDMASARVRVAELRALFGDEVKIKRALLPMGLMAYANGEFKNAVGYLSELSKDPRALYFQALAKRKLSHYQEALALWENIQRNHQKTPWAELAKFQLAETYFSIGDDALSKQACLNALETIHKGVVHSKFLFRLATLHFREQDYKSTLDILAKIPETDQLNDRTMILTAESLAKTEDSKNLFDQLARRKSKDQDLESLYQLAWAALHDKNHEKAVALSEKGLEDFYNTELTPRLLLLQGLAFEHLGKEAEALATFQTIADRFPNSLVAAQAVHWTLLAYMRLGRSREAVTHTAYLWNNLSEDVRRQHPDAAFWLAEAHLRLNRFEDADTYYDQFLVKATPQHELIPYAQFQKSVTLTKLEKPELALTILDQFAKGALEQNKPTWVTLAQHQKGHIHFTNKQYEQAIVAYRASTQSAKSLYYEAVALYQLDYYSDAIGKWMQLANAFPDSAYAEKGAFKAGRTLFETGRSSEAVLAYNSFIKAYPNSPLAKEALLQSAHSLYNMGKTGKAIPLYRNYLAKYNTPLDLRSVAPFLVSCYIKQDKTINEIEDLAHGLPPTEQMSSLYWENGADQFNSRKYDESTRLFGNLLASFPAGENSAQAMFYRAEGLFLSGAWLDAQFAYDSYLKSFSGDQKENAPLALFHKAIALYNQVNLLEAAAIFEQVITVYPDSPLVPEAKENLVLCYYNLGDFKTMEEMKTRYQIPAAQETPRVAKSNQESDFQSEASTPTVNKPKKARGVYVIPREVKKAKSNIVSQNTLESGTQ